MTSFTFLGDYTTDVQLPDLSVIRVNPGDVVDLEYKSAELGHLWVGSKTNAAQAAVAAAITPEETV